MNSKKWQKVQEVFEEALKIDVTDREALLKNKCGSDQDLIEILRSMLNVDSQPHKLFGESFSDPAKLSERLSLVGQSVSQFRIIEKIGHGGMGEVYCAYDNKLNRNVAIKLLPPYFSSDMKLRSRLIEEAQSAAALNHPNIVTVYEVGEFAESLFIAMEYVKGRSLRELIAQGPVNIDKALGIVEQVGQGLAKAHAEGIIHRDVKPENIILTDENLVKILDFGLAKGSHTSKLTKSGIPIGTANYMSPEQAQGQSVDNRSDIFSVGVILYELLAGKAPFERNNFVATIHAIVNDTQIAISKIRSGVSKKIEKIINRSLAKSQESRYQTIESFLSDLHSVQTGDYLKVKTSTKLKRRSETTLTIAVLHLQNLGVKDDDYLSFGITEDLIVDLTRIGIIRVIPMRTILKYRDSTKSLKEIAKELKVTHILDGSIQRDKKSIRVAAQLVDVIDGSNLWASRWSKPLNVLPQIKQSLAQGICNSLEIETGVTSKAEVGVPEAEDPMAYEFYLRGKYKFEQKHDTSDVDIALGLYRKALEIEPYLLAARSGVAEIMLYKGKSKQARQELDRTLQESLSRKSKVDQANTLLLLARYFRVQGNWSEAVINCQQALIILEGIDDLAGEARVLSEMISSLLPQSKFDEALSLFDRVVEINRKLNDDEKVAESLKSIGMIYRQKAEYGRAREYYERALELAQKQGNLALQSACLGNLGNVFLCQDNLDIGLKYYREALDIDTQLGNKSAIQAWLPNMAHILIRKGDYQEAVKILKDAKKISNELGDKRVYSHILNSLSEVYLLQGKYERVLVTSMQALKATEKMDYKSGISNAHHQLGSAYFCMRELNNAEQHYESALHIAKSADLRRNIAWIYFSLSAMHYLRRDFSLSHSNANQALKISRDIGEIGLRLLSSAQLAALQVCNGKYNAGKRNLLKYKSEQKQVKDARIKLIIERLLGDILIRHGPTPDERTEGRHILENALKEAKEKQLAPDAEWIQEILNSKFELESYVTKKP